MSCYAGAIHTGHSSIVQHLISEKVGRADFIAIHRIDNVSRRVFDNYAEFEALYGDVPEMEELPYPRAMSARQVPATLRQKLSGREVA